MKRSGFSLIEVIIATAILLGSVFVLSELAGLGRRQSQRAEQHTRAQELCEQTLNEILFGERPLLEVEDEPLLPPGEPIDGRDQLQDLRDSREQEDQLFVFEDPDDRAVVVFEPGQAGSESEWLYSVRVLPLEDYSGLAAMTVVVRQSDETIKRPATFQLTRWIPQPETPDDSAGGFPSPTSGAFP
jgi:prepilin-type N-terminal cleavage/methylation domain-containing protein